MDGRFHKRRGDYEGYYDSYNYGGYSCGRSSQTLGTTSMTLSYNNLKLPLFWGTFGPYVYVAWEREVEFFFYFYCQASRNRYGVENLKGQGQRQGQAKVKFMEPSIIEESTKVKELPQTIIAAKESFEDSCKDEGEKLAYKSIKIINFFPSNFYLCFEIYFKEIKLFSLVFMENGYQFYFLNSLGTLLEKKQFIEFNYISCAIPRVDKYHYNLVVPSTYKCVSSYNSLKNQLVISDNIDVPSCFRCELVHEDSIVDLEVVRSRLDCELFDVFHDNFKEKFAGNRDSILSFFEIFMKNFVGALSLKKPLAFLGNQVEFLCHEQKLSNVIKSLNTLHENTFGFQFCHLHFKKLLLKDFENQNARLF
ncbi:hypothetical protein M9H77_02202 [Catharanthus roseus]|uniref:Uncharacterized protein n=1 Tax=Catharanthus roseus TaxID=4058 RepID=A0ACC0C7Q0_CATRO|nr:hypothetical protein M9H77_02202 [Catharanthus roseus]